MKINLLAINIGNTRTQIGSFLNGELDVCESFENEMPSNVVGQAAQAIYQTLKESESEYEEVAVMLASVNPDVESQIIQELHQRLDCPVARVERDAPVPIGRQLDPETIVGDDRLLNAAAAFSLLKQACVVVDAGTAITVDFVDGAGTFHGGAIAPGAQMMLDALHQQTEQLPEVNFDKPKEAIGHNTAEAMRSAVFHGLRGMVRELVEQYAQDNGAYPIVVATGGDSAVLFEDYDLIERLVPSLTLLGMKKTLESILLADDE